MGPPFPAQSRKWLCCWTVASSSIAHHQRQPCSGQNVVQRKLALLALAKPCLHQLSCGIAPKGLDQGQPWNQALKVEVREGAQLHIRQLVEDQQLLCEVEQGVVVEAEAVGAHLVGRREQYATGSVLVQG